MAQVPFKSLIANSVQGGTLVAAVLNGDVALLGAALDSDVVVEPVRAPLIPGMPAVKDAAKAAGVVYGLFDAPRVKQHCAWTIGPCAKRSPVAAQYCACLIEK
jgi:precorrin-4 methylase